MMRTRKEIAMTATPRVLIRLALSIIGAGHLAVFGLAFFAPAWFFATVAPFPPYNAHFLADIGVFNAPLGVGLLIAAMAPERYRLMVGLAAGANLLHAGSHLRDTHLHRPPYMTLATGLIQQCLILMPGLILLVIVLVSRRGAARGGEVAAPGLLQQQRTNASEKGKTL
jgi:hypothetical protein